MLLATLTLPSAHAAMPGRWGGGLLLGFGKPSQMSLGLQYGLELNIPLGPAISVVALYHATSRSVTITGETATLESTQSMSWLGAGATYRLGAEFSAGLKLGLAKFSSEGTAIEGTTTITSTTSTSGLFIEPVVVYEVPASANITLGAELGYALTLTSGVPGGFSLLGFAKYWF